MAQPLVTAKFIPSMMSLSPEQAQGIVPEKKTEAEGVLGFYQNPVVRGLFFVSGVTAMAVSYSRSKSLLRAFGASFVSVPYLIYVAIDTRKATK